MTDAPLLWIDSCTSTNTALRELRPDAPDGFAVATREQTAGRGQRGNSWEAQPGMNVTMSVLLRDLDIPASRQFVISEMVALAVQRTVNEELAPDSRLEARIKWPNDIYVGDSKIAGILIEVSLAGSRVDSAIIGIGLNVNQTAFLSDAPNPVSIRQLTGRLHDIEALADAMRQQIAAYAALIRGGASDPWIHRDYMANLWRGSGMQQWLDTASGTPFEAEVIDVEPSGHLLLSGGRRYAFKEVAPIL